MVNRVTLKNSLIESAAGSLLPSSQTGALVRQASSMSVRVWVIE